VDNAKTFTVFFSIVYTVHGRGLTVKYLCFRVSDRVATVEFEVCVSTVLKNNFKISVELLVWLAALAR